MSEELTQLKERADQLGIKYHPNIGVEALRQKVSEALSDKAPPASDKAPDPEAKADAAPEEKPAPAKTKAETEQELRTRIIVEATALVRCRITCLNPAKAHSKGEIITVGNKYTGAISKMVAFGEATDNGYHIPKIIFDELKQRKFNSVRSVKAPNGTHRPEQRLVPEFALEVLEPLTPEDLERLARQQAAAAGQ